jgi:tetratricopeptide (TPR) repeat protein
VAKGVELVNLLSVETENQIGRVSMQIVADNNLVLIDSFSSRRFAEFQKQAGYGRLYQQIVSRLIKDTYSKQFFTDLGNKLVASAEYAYGLRRMEEVEQLSQLLVNLPLADEYRITGRYFEALCLYQKGKFAEARVALEYVAEHGLPIYRARALLCISATFYVKNDLQSFARYCVEANQAAVGRDWCDYRTIVEAQRNLVMVKSLTDDHHGALADLERLFPLVRSTSRWHPDLFLTYLNSYAVELGEVGRFEEALNVSEKALASPYARIYREVQETRDEIVMKSRRASRYVVAVKRKISCDGNVVSLPMQYRGSAASQDSANGQAQRLARIFDLQAWKHRLAKEAKNVVPEEKPGKQLSDRELLLRLMDIISEKDLTKDQLARMLEAIEKIACEPKGEIN